MTSRFKFPALNFIPEDENHFSSIISKKCYFGQNSRWSFFSERCKKSQVRISGELGERFEDLATVSELEL